MPLREVVSLGVVLTGVFVTPPPLSTAIVIKSSLACVVVIEFVLQELAPVLGVLIWSTALTPLHSPIARAAVVLPVVHATETVFGPVVFAKAYHPICACPLTDRLAGVKNGIQVLTFVSVMVMPDVEVPTLEAKTTRRFPAVLFDGYAFVTGLVL